MDSAAPIPKPRTNCVTGLGKKPIPKPRQKLFKGPLTESVDTSKECQTRTDVSKSDVHGGISSTSEQSHEKVKNIIEKKDVSALFEKSVRNITRRFTTRPSSIEKEPELPSSKLLRSQSLPSEDIFQSISFKSPIAIGSDHTEIVVEDEQDTKEYCSERFEAPPPIYPPPPLPDESVYDEVQSVVSSHYVGSDSSHSVESNQLSQDGAYEPVAIECVLGKQVKPLILPKAPVVQPRGNVLRSDSWSFYDSVYSDKVNESTCSLSIPSAKDVSNGRTLSGCSVSPSSLSELDALGYNSGDENFDDDNDIRSISPSRSITSQSVSIQNELYDSWEPLKSTTFPSVAWRKKDSERTIPSKSVILEFDPLYANASKVNSISNNAFLEVNENLPKDSGTSLYGNINQVYKGVNKKNEHVYDAVCDLNEPPPVPPRRTDSIHVLVPSQNETTIYAEVQHKGPLQRSPPTCLKVKEETESNKQDVSIAGSTKALLRTASNDSINKDDARRGKLTRLDSVKRAVKIVADSANWSPGVIRRSTKLGTSLKDSMRSALRQEKSDCVANIQDSSGKIVVDKPEIQRQKNFAYSGLVYKVGVGKERQQDYVHRWCVLAEDKITFYADKSATSIKEVVTLNSILSVHVVMDHKISVDGDCFEINTASKGRGFIFGTSGSSERRVWMQKILESLTQLFPLRIISDYTKGGWCYMKEGISGKWTCAWIIIHKRMFYYYCLSKENVQEVDLRKARCVALQDPDEGPYVLQVSEKGPLILVDCQGVALYLQMDTSNETSVWKKVIQAAVVDNGPNLDQQQLTKDDIPVIVDKCIKFIYAHGSMSEGIYRRSGANSNVTRLLELFRLDAWTVHLSRQEYTEYDVSSVLKRFFRDLPEPLLTTELHGQFCDIAAGKYKESRVGMYRRTLEQLPPVNFLTTRKLISHLHTIHEQREKNRMPVENLAAIWGPTLMHIETSETLEWSRLETVAVADLISHHVQLFEVDAEEQNRERRMQEVLERINASISNAPQSKQSGELMVWIYLHNRDSGNCVNITIGPQKTAGEVCTDLAEKFSLSPHDLLLEEIVCGGSLTRFLHYTEKILDTVLRWAYWDDVDRKDNCLVLRPNDRLKEIVPLAKPPVAMSGELRYADIKSKSFKSYVFEFSQAKLCYYKDKKGSVKLNEWKIEDIVWYVGHEPKRNPQTRWSITFIEKSKRNKRCKDYPFFGNTIAGTNKEEQLRWMAALLIGEHPQGLIMSPVLLS